MMSVSAWKNLSLLVQNAGIYDTEIHFLQIKFYAIGLYAEPGVVNSLSEFKGKTVDELLAEGSGFFSSFCKGVLDLRFLRVQAF
jgi:hypothetical protein